MNSLHSMLVSIACNRNFFRHIEPVCGIIANIPDDNKFQTMFKGVLSDLANEDWGLWGAISAAILLKSNIQMVFDQNSCRITVDLPTVEEVQDFILCCHDDKDLELVIHITDASGNSRPSRLLFGLADSQFWFRGDKSVFPAIEAEIDTWSDWFKQQDEVQAV